MKQFRAEVHLARSTRDMHLIAWFEEWKPDIGELLADNQPYNSTRASSHMICSCMNQCPSRLVFTALSIFDIVITSVLNMKNDKFY